MTQYTVPHSLPVIEPVIDPIRSASGDNLWKQINALAASANSAISAEGARVEGAAKTLVVEEVAKDRTRLGTLEATTTEIQNGKPLGTEHLSTVTTPGSYYQASNINATPDRGYPVALAGDMNIRPWGAPGTGRYQRRYYPYIGGRFYTQNVVGGVADPWITFDSIRDTGWRNIDVTDVNGSIRDAISPGTLRLRRVGATVTARIEGVKLAPGTGGGFIFPNAIPTGFGGWNKLGSAIRASMGDVLGAQWEHDVYVTDNDIFWAAATSSSLAKSATRPTDQAHRLQGEMSWTTDHSFPNALPGTAV